MKRLVHISFFIWLLLQFAGRADAATYTVGTGGNYTTLKAAFDAINAGTITGAIVLQIISNTNETAAAVLNASGSGSASYTSVKIYPTGTGYTITGALATPLIDLNGDDNVTIDGRVNRTGSTKDLVITNTSTSNTAGTSTIRFINDATSDSVKYCTIKGSTTDPAGGILFFSTTTATTGNDGNYIDNNNITCDANANRPLNAICSYGTSSYENSGNTISNNYIYNYLYKGAITSRGIYLYSNSTTWTISGNSFYETAAFSPTASNTSYCAIDITNIASGNGFTITGNYIGGSSANCGGSP